MGLPAWVEGPSNRLLEQVRALLQLGRLARIGLLKALGVSLERLRARAGARPGRSRPAGAGSARAGACAAEHAAQAAELARELAERLCVRRWRDRLGLAHVGELDRERQRAALEAA